MSRQLLNLPINIPWRQIAVSPDMMDEKFCNKLFPFAWRSSMAISVYEPKQEDLPEELCGDQITYIKVTTSITGYQPSKSETKKLEKLKPMLSDTFPDLPKEDTQATIDRITRDYFACYGVMLNVAVFPSQKTKTELLERLRVKFAEIEHIEPGSLQPNPFIVNGGLEFEAPGAVNNNIVDIFPVSGDGKGELDIQKKLIITIPDIPTLAAVEAKIVHYSESIITMEAFTSGVSVGKKTTELEQGQLYTLIIEAGNIDKVIITAPGNKASLLEFAYLVGKEVPVELDEYPHIIDFEPKRRDLYQAATQNEEVLSGSSSGITTNKSFTHTESTESNLNASASSIPGVDGGIGGSIEGGITNKTVDQDQRSIQTDASRERRETQGTSAQLSQMYNLLTGYHAGTNRASFLSLARPHVLQPTDFRTFVQGLRAIEGMQDYFLIVSRPKGIEGLCIETSLETGHFKEDTPIIEPPEEFHERSETFWVKKHVNGELIPVPFTDNCESFNKHKTIDHDDGQWVVDQRESRKQKENDPPESGWDDAHPGIAEIEINDAHGGEPSLHNYEYGPTPDGISVEVSGRICGARYSTEAAHFERKYKVFTRSVQPKTSYEQPSADIGKLLITSRGLCTCFKSGDCIEIVPRPPKEPIIVDRIVDEPIIRIDKAIMTKNASRQNRMPLEKQFLQQVQNALIRSHRSTSRHAIDDNVGFLESDYFKDQIKNLLPEKHLKKPLGEVKGLPDKVVKTLGGDLTINQALSMDLARFASRTGLSIKEASNARYLLMGISPKSDKDEDVSPKQD